MSLADNLIKKGVLKNKRLIEAFRIVDRKDFLPRGREAALRGVPDYSDEEAYGDYPLPIGEGQTISQPWTVAFMLELLDPKPGENIMEIGYGSGWQTALLLACGANVWAIERIPTLCELGKRNVEKWLSEHARFLQNQKLADENSRRGRAPERGRLFARERAGLRNFQTQVSDSGVCFFCQDGTFGLQEVAKKIGSPRFGEAGGFDKIIAAAAAWDEIPKAWRDQLRVGGKIVAPVGNSILEFIKKSEVELKSQEYPGFSFVPLVTDKK